MDPQLTKQLIRRRLILENSFQKTTIKDDNKIKNIETSSVITTDTTSQSNIKNNFLEKIKKFESFSDNQIKITHQNVDKPRNNTEIVNKFNKLNKDPTLNKKLITNKLELDSSKGLFNNTIDVKQKQDIFQEKIKQFESSFVLENTISNENTNNVKGHLKSSNESTKTLKTKLFSKSDYNNWELDKNWVFYTDYSNLTTASESNIKNIKNILKKKLIKKKKKNTEIVHNIAQIVLNK